MSAASMYSKMLSLRKQIDSYPSKNYPKYDSGKITWKQYEAGEARLEKNYTKAMHSYWAACDRQFGKKKK